MVKMIIVLVSIISLLKNVSSFCKCKHISAIFNDQSFNNTLTNDIISFEQLGPGNFCDFLFGLL